MESDPRFGIPFRFIAAFPKKNMPMREGLQEARQGPFGGIFGGGHSCRNRSAWINPEIVELGESQSIFPVGFLTSPRI